MNNNTIILSMTTWPPRERFAIMAMQSLVLQDRSEGVHFLLTLSREEWNYDGKHPDCPSPRELIHEMEKLGVEVLWDKGNMRSHKKLMPALQKYPDNPILVVDDDNQQQCGWLQTFINDHHVHPEDIIYGHSSSRVTIGRDGRILEGLAQRGMYTFAGRVTYSEKPANGSAGTLYPAHTFRDMRFYNRKLIQQLCPTSDETWQWAFCVMADKTYRCLSDHNTPRMMGADPEYALARINLGIYTQYHNAIAERFPLYKEMLAERIRRNPLL